MTTCSSQCGCRRPADPSAPPTTAADVDSLLERLVAEWHVVDPGHGADGLEGRICDLHKFNFQLWHEEDIARSPDVTDARIAEVLGRCAQSNDFRMRRWIVTMDGTISALADHLCTANKYGTDGYLTTIGGLAGQVQRATHEIDVRRDRHARIRHHLEPDQTD